MPRVPVRANRGRLPLLRMFPPGWAPDPVPLSISCRNSGGYGNGFLAILDPSFLPLLWKCPRNRVNSKGEAEASPFLT